jgi:hypothetical protein
MYEATYVAGTMAPNCAEGATSEILDRPWQCQSQLMAPKRRLNERDGWSACWGEAAALALRTAAHYPKPDRHRSKNRAAKLVGLGPGLFTRKWPITD